MPQHIEQNGVPFGTAEETWFWFVQANQARLEGARKNSGGVMRPCEPIDILRILDRLYRTRRLLMDHLRVLKFYGARMMPPERFRKSEARAHSLWREAMQVMEPVFIAKKIMREPLSAQIISMEKARMARTNYACEVPL